MTIEMKLARLALYPFNPTSLEDLSRILVDPFYRVMSLSIDGLENLLSSHVLLPDGTGCLVFASSRMIAFLSRATDIYCDSCHASPLPFLWVGRNGVA